jgi:hypothetical protein
LDFVILKKKFKYKDFLKIFFSEISSEFCKIFQISSEFCKHKQILSAYLSSPAEAASPDRSAQSAWASSSTAIKCCIFAHF